MGTIVCATRGGQGSRAVRLAAINKALETGSPLLFLFVVDEVSATRVKEELRPTYMSELRWMGRALLQISRSHAQAAGVEAQTQIRQGVLRDEIVTCAEEHDASIILLGAPRNITTTVFGDDAIEKFAQELMALTTAPVEIVRP